MSKNAGENEDKDANPIPDNLKEQIEAVAYARAALALAKMGNTASVFLSILADPGQTQKTLAEAAGVSTVTVRRLTENAQEAGVLEGASGSWVPVLPMLDGSAPVAQAKAVDVRKRLADRLTVATNASLVLDGTRFRSPLERDVAVALTAAGFKFETEVAYSTLIATTREWTADFVVRFQKEGAEIVVVIEVTGRPDAQDALREKLNALTKANVPHLVVQSQQDLRGLVREVVQLAKSVPVVRKVEEPKDEDAPYVNGSGVYVDPRESKRRPHHVPPAIAVMQQLPPLPAPTPIPGLDLPDFQIRHVEELEEVADYRFVQRYVTRARALASAKLERRKATESVEDRAVRLKALLDASYRPRRVIEPALEVVASRYPLEAETELTGEECSELDECLDATEGGPAEF